MTTGDEPIDGYEMLFDFMMDYVRTWPDTDIDVLVEAICEKLHENQIHINDEEFMQFVVDRLSTEHDEGELEIMLH